VNENLRISELLQPIVHGSFGQPFRQIDFEESLTEGSYLSDLHLLSFQLLFGQETLAFQLLKQRQLPIADL